MSVVIDASAILAFLHGEPGADYVEQHFDDALVSTVNWAEVIQKSLLRNADVNGMHEEFSGAGIKFVPLSVAQAEKAGSLWESTKKYGLSLADRSCIALACEKEIPVLTADKAWAKLKLPIKVELVR